jgi:hypothetical protein
MRKIAFLGLALSFLTACGSDSPSELVGYKTTMKVNSVFNAGKVARGEVIHANFVVENTGDYPLVLSDVTPSCSCTISDWSKDPIPPGEKGFVKADVKTESFSEGPVTRSVMILSNTTPPNTKVVVEATIIK